ncbi:beta-hexosaminidase subunit beta-like [Maniola hyperantus]|uniref:beta-hexosaminidase subunit beta-like n=1 Tax=Aphantopus hyperantus TaxID=2795564 RepID=UPI001569DB29|nr:beta-hexosaminidase subunit beta-like [Maniola hyperantus]
MLRYFVVLYLFFGEFYARGMWLSQSGPKYPPTKGEVWPKPQIEVKSKTYYVFNPSQFKVKIMDQTCDILTNAIARYSYIIENKIGPKARHKEPAPGAAPIANTDALYKGHLNELEITLTSPCEELPHLDMDESYNLTVSSSSKLISSSIWGAIRGLETFAQLFYISDDYNDVRVNETVISDFPRYKHRGLLLDTSRHFITLSNILKTLDAMAMNKMNVFHWHIVDDQSFPYQSERFPELSERGAYDPSMIYTKEDIERVIEYARNRGIRVIPEFDVPGHTGSWGNAYRGILTECYENGRVIGLGPMDPTKNMTYKLLRDLFKEVQNLFPDKYFHVGGDEVELQCWQSNPNLISYMKANNLTAADLHALFMRNVIPLLAKNTTPVVWQEVYDEGVTLSKDTLIQVWKYNWITEMVNVLNTGHRVLFSSLWYLDAMRSEWKDYYIADPRQMVYAVTGNETFMAGIVGGEACMWGEMVDDRNVINRVWPRASAVAERLWSFQDNTYRYDYRSSHVPRETYNRIEEHACRMVRRGIDAQPPSGPGFCVV